MPKPQARETPRVSLPKPLAEKARRIALRNGQKLPTWIRTLVARAVANEQRNGK